MIDPGIQGALLRVASPCARNTQQWGDCTQQPAQQPAPLPSLKALAVAALTRNNPRNNDATSPENPRNNGPILEAGLLRDIRDRLHRLADAEGIDPGIIERRAEVLDEYAGEDDATLAACLRAWATEQPACCANCGPVCLPPHWPERVACCPWCCRTRAGLSILW